MSYAILLDVYNTNDPHHTCFTIVYKHTHNSVDIVASCKNYFLSRMLSTEYVYRLENTMCSYK